MFSIDKLLQIPLPDALAFAGLCLAYLALGYVIEHPPRRFPSVSLLMNLYRREWMSAFVTREPRIFDASIIDSLRQGTAFFASACMIAIGGGLALVGNSAPILGLARQLTLAPVSAEVEQARAVVVVLFLANAFLKFVWSHRLFGYCQIVMAAAPNSAADPLATHRARQAAEINIHAAKGFNRGLRSVYFALGTLGWLLGPEVLMLTTLATVIVLLRREFASHSRRVLLDAQN
ncbi:MAG: DUF599 domain-containing protein [Paracoccaceae bacterium]|nr:DUF599 domain-containing protein [Paracoccaceae bacterium]